MPEWLNSLFGDGSSNVITDGSEQNSSALIKNSYQPKTYYPAAGSNYQVATTTENTPTQFVDTSSLDYINKQNALKEGQILDAKIAGPNTYGGLTAGDWMGAGGLALQGYNTFFGPGKDIAAKQMQGIDANIKLANQQVKSNKQAMADRKQFNNTWANANNGLAASYANKIG